MARRKNKKKTVFSAAALLIALIAAAYSYFGGAFDGWQPSEANAGASFAVHFIDVGQGSSTLIQSGDKGVLIDAGESEYGKAVCDYIRKCGVKELSYVILTHPHSDHMGGMSEVLNVYGAGKFYMPELLDESVPTTRSYERLLDVLSDKEIDAQYAQPGEGFTFETASFTFIGPVKKVDDLNNMSLVTRIVYNDTSFLICGDAEKEEMKTLVNTPYTLRSDIYLMSHHGSSTGIQKEFLRLVSPEVAVISCAAGNSYGHPHREALDYIRDNNITSYRTDIQGHVIVTCKGTGYTVKTVE